jgi:hypothetical protein
MHVGCLLLSSGILPTNAQFAQHVAGHLQHLGSQPLFSATVVQPNQPSSDGPVFIQPRIQETFFQPGIELPKCPYARVLSTQGVPARWAHMTLEQQAADPVNAAVVQLVRYTHSISLLQRSVLSDQDEAVTHQPQHHSIEQIRN